MKTLTSFLAVIAMGGVVAVQADTVINPVNVTLTGADEFFPAVHIIDGSGLSAQPNSGDLVPANWNHYFGDPGNQSWVSGAFGFPSDWFAASGTIPTFVLDLGQEVTIDTVHLWAYSGGTGFADTYQGNSAKIVELRFNTDFEGNILFSGPAVEVDLDHGPLNQEPADFVIPDQTFSLGSQLARYVEMRVTDNWFEPPGDATGGNVARGGDRVGLGEVRFSVVPEPATLGLLGAGLGLLLAFRGRGRKAY
jgi:PEP-CTERM motif